MKPPRVLRLLTDSEEAWKKRAGCAGYADTGADLFFPRRGARVETAKRLCLSCPVIEECLEYALGIDPQDDHGIWGGTTPGERKRMRAERNLPRDHRYVYLEPPVSLPTLTKTHFGEASAS